MNNCRNIVSSFTILIAIFFIQIELSQSVWTTFVLSSFQDMNSTDSVVYFDLKPKRISRTTYGITGTVTINDDFKKYTVEVKMYYSASGNDDYVLHPLKKPLTPVCDTCNDEYRKYLMKAFSTTTDMPNSEDKDICPLFVPKTYNIKDCRFETKFIPQFLNRGWYKIHILIYDLNGVLSGGLETHTDLH